MAQTPFDELTKAARDAMYVTVGFGVLAVQRLQVQRAELAKRLAAQVEAGKDQVGKVGPVVDGQRSALESRIAMLDERIEALLDQLQATVPEQARPVVQAARERAKAARDLVTSRLAA